MAFFKRYSRPARRQRRPTTPKPWNRYAGPNNWVDSVWLTEHHFSRPGIVSATLTVLACLSSVLNLIFFVNYGGFENRTVLESMELFATRVMPHFVV